MIRIDASTDPIIAALSRAAAELDDLTPLMVDIGEEMLSRTDQNFLTATAPDGTPWAPRSQTTLDAYARRNPPVTGIGTLRLTDTMRKTINYEAGPGHVDWGSNAIQAAVMQFGAAKGAFGTTARGSSIPWGAIPARPFVGVGPDDETAILAVIGDWLESLLKK
ncbi:phage virion morphogenesis protein [Citreimonas salinaria]|uniref:Phage virion morphogenesis (Putative tail completion) protein n=1 Tax=Citreimonas salinaria TaxID=321339 RepID=A0A1H3KT72_9RHOB|nr:phage virion morphogenesis protein [Citreimonas salinaria]SDY55280.1 phage virion morphogenesis (putative tail completion) protein [Citreimonas salinaria]